MSRIVEVVKQALIRPHAVRKNVHLGRRVHVGPGSVLWAPRSLTVCDDVYIGKRCTIECDGRIGRGVLVGNNVGLVGRHDHDVFAVGQVASRSSWIGRPVGAAHPGLGLEINVDDDVWIGYGAVVLSGVSIGRGAIVGAGCVVTHDVDPYAIVVGNPERVVGWRFTAAEQTIHETALAARGST